MYVVWRDTPTIFDLFILLFYHYFTGSCVVLLICIKTEKFRQYYPLHIFLLIATGFVCETLEFLTRV